MNNYDENMVRDFIYMFVDGETDSAQQKALFHELADNPDLQNEFQQAIEINKGFVADKDNIYPSAAVASALFTKAGFKEPVATPVPEPQVATTTKPVGFAGIMKKFGTPAFSGLAGAVITALFFYYAVLPEYNGTKVFDGKKVISEQYANPVQKQNIPMIKSEENNIAKLEKPSKPRIIYVYRDLPAKKEAINSNNMAIDNNDNGIDNKQTEMISDSKYLNNKNISLTRSNPIFGEKQVSGLNIMEHDTKENRHFIEIQGTSDLGFTPFRAYKSENDIVFNNVNISYFYQIDRHNSLGLKLGQETFQIFSVREDTAGNVLFTKEPSISWLGGNYRYSLRNFGFIENLYPYMEVFGGYSRFGPVFKGGIGVTYNPENILSFTLGVETTWLGYQLRNQYNLAGKYAFVYSMGVHF